MSLRRWLCPQEGGSVPGQCPKALLLCPLCPDLVAVSLSPSPTTAVPKGHPLPTATRGCMGQVRARPQPHPASKDTFVTWLWLPRAAGSLLPGGPGEAKWQRAPNGVPSSAPEGWQDMVAGWHFPILGITGDTLEVGTAWGRGAGTARCPRGTACPAGCSVAGSRVSPHAAP